MHNAPHAVDCTYLIYTYMYTWIYVYMDTNLNIKIMNVQLNSVYFASRTLYRELFHYLIYIRENSLQQISINDNICH